MTDENADGGLVVRDQDARGPGRFSTPEWAASQLSGEVLA
jgi:hypothetical protein